LNPTDFTLQDYRREFARRSGAVDKSGHPPGPLARLTKEELVRSFQKSIYGEDTRKEVAAIAVRGSPGERNKRATAALVDTGNLAHDGAVHRLSSASFGQAFGLCREEKFYHQPCAPFASGFLVYPNILATAEHCLRDIDHDLDRLRVVFDYELLGDHPRLVFDESQVYGARELVGSGQGQGQDWALVRLDRSVPDRLPVVCRTSGRVDDATRLYMLGHPCGLPMKLADSAEITDNSDETVFRTNLDAFGGNSGSPVFDAASHVVEGLLVRGQADFLFDSAHGCKRTANFDVATGGYEEVCRAPLFAAHLRRRELGNLAEPGHAGPWRGSAHDQLEPGRPFTLLPLPAALQAELAALQLPHLGAHGRQRPTFALELLADGTLEVSGHPWLLRADALDKCPRLPVACGEAVDLRFFPRGDHQRCWIDAHIVHADWVAVDLQFIVDRVSRADVTLHIAKPTH
jgi:hypothetical protein